MPRSTRNMREGDLLDLQADHLEQTLAADQPQLHRRLAEAPPAALGLQRRLDGFHLPLVQVAQALQQRADALAGHAGLTTENVARLEEQRSRPPPRRAGAAVHAQHDQLARPAGLRHQGHHVPDGAPGGDLAGQAQHPAVRLAQQQHLGRARQPLERDKIRVRHGKKQGGVSGLRHRRATGVAEFYRANHRYQTLDFVREKSAQFAPGQHGRMSVWEAIEFLDTLVDDSDPDTDVTQLQHLLQTSEADPARRASPLVRAGGLGSRPGQDLVPVRRASVGGGGRHLPGGLPVLRQDRVPRVLP